MRRTSYLLAAVAALSLALAPGLADARAGGGSSFGSRGSMTWSAPPSTRTAPTAGAADAAQHDAEHAHRPGVTAPGSTFGSGMGARSGFASGLMGGLIGAGIGGLLFGHGFMGGGGLGFGGFLGFLLQIGLVVLAVSLLVRWFRRRQRRPRSPAGPTSSPAAALPSLARWGARLGPPGRRRSRSPSRTIRRSSSSCKRIQAAGASTT